MSTVEQEDETPLRLLGPPALRSGGRSHPFEAERPYLLLAYLACRRDWVRRDELADWLYPGRGLDSARSNLRKVIFLARKLPGVAIEQQGDLLRWAPDSDLARFDRACDEQRWADALAAHGGELLLGLDAAWPADAADWLDAERRRVQARWHEACTRRLQELAGDPAAQRTLAEAMLRQDPLDDLAQQALGRAQQALGRPDEALQSLAAYGERLSRDLGLAPSSALQSLDAELRSGAAAPVAAPSVVGRRQERVQALERLASGDCRLLTLLGPPGVGKSTLARALQAELQAPWVPLEDLAHADQVPARVAGALAVALDASLPPWDALARALAARADVLVLDNAEHLPLAAGLAGVLAAAPRLRVLATSRAPLGVAGEWRLPIEGLPLPDADETDPEVLDANDAVHLFVLRARAVAPAFVLATEAADVVRLVHEVAGLPLAIELLAAWRRLMPVADILDELRQSLDVLEPSTPSERSVRASFSRAWQQLGAVEQRVLSQLALLPAPTSREMVRNVVQAPLPVLASLADRSLLQTDGDGRFSLHPLIRRCAAPLAGDAAALLERHARHVAHAAATDGGNADDRLPHLNAAWRWAVAQPDAALLAQLRAPYVQLLQRRALWRDGVQAMLDADAALRPAAGAPGAAMHALAGVLVGRAALNYQCGNLDDALAAAQEAERLAREAGDENLASQAASRSGAVFWQRGNHAAARAAFMRRVEQLAERPGAEVDRASAEAWVALVDKAEGRYDDALRRYDTAVRLLREAGRLTSHLYLLNNRANLLRLLGRVPEALDTLHEALRLARAGGQLEDEPFLLTNIAISHEDTGELDLARTWVERAVASAREHGEPMIEVAARLARARVTAVSARAWQPALGDVWDALSIAERLQAQPLRAGALAAAGCVLAAAGDLPRGAALVHWAAAQPDIGAAERLECARRLAHVAPGAPTADQTRALLPPEAPFDNALRLLQQATRT